MKLTSSRQGAGLGLWYSLRRRPCAWVSILSPARLPVTQDPHSPSTPQPGRLVSAHQLNLVILELSLKHILWHSLVFNEPGDAGQMGPPVCLGPTCLGVLICPPVLAARRLCQGDSVKCTDPKCETWDAHSPGSLLFPAMQFKNWCQQISPLIFSFFLMQGLLVLS